MTVREALRDLTRALHLADLKQQRMGLPPLSVDGTRSWEEWQTELDVRVNKLCAETNQYGRPTQAMLDSLGAQVVALKMAVARAEAMDVVAQDYGDAA